MIGWTSTGERVTLLPWQEHAVRALLRWDDQKCDVLLLHSGRGTGKTTVLRTAAQYIEARCAGDPLEDDPLWEPSYGGYDAGITGSVTVRPGAPKQNSDAEVM